jgi:enoyl-CoA hydratase/carnithine racemase
MPGPTGVRLEHDAGVAILTIDRPEARNAIGLRTIGDLEVALADIAQSEARVLVFTGAGDRAFVSGGDLKELASIRTADGAEEMARAMRRVLDDVATLPIPVIAALNGHALGGGAEVAIAADIRVAAADAKIGFTQSTLGIVPAWGGAERLVGTIGRSRALLLIATGEVLSAADAYAVGLIDIVYSRAEFDAGWRELARRVADLPAGVTRAIKEVISLAAPSEHPQTENDAVRAFSKLWISDAHWAAVEQATARRRGG